MPITATAPVVAQQITATPVATPAPPQMSKSVYDSLAPLDLPSKPVIYVDETSSGASNGKPATAVSVAATTEGVTTADESSRDEKAKLESILLGKMMEKGTAAGMMMMDGSGGSNPNSLHHSHMANRFLGLNKWPRSNMLGPGGQAAALINLANRPLPANYVCTICKKPGHHKQLCPEAVSL